jgi:hypothetical protein
MPLSETGYPALPLPSPVNGSEVAEVCVVREVRSEGKKGRTKSATIPQIETVPDPLGTAIPTRARAVKQEADAVSLGTMTIDKYVSISDGTHLLDGGRAQTHLTVGLGMVAPSSTEVPTVAIEFAQWIVQNANAIKVHPNGPVFLLPPDWFNWTESCVAGSRASRMPSSRESGRGKPERSGFLRPDRVPSKRTVNVLVARAWFWPGSGSCPCFRPSAVRCHPFAEFSREDRG